jgi:hypothetical protein
MDKNKRGKIILLMLLCFMLINLTVISGYIFSINYGSLHLNSGEKYIVNIPFIKTSGENSVNITENPIVCGTAEDDYGEAIEGIEVRITYIDEMTTLGENTTNEDGKYCIILPKINSKQEYDIYLEYNNETFSDNLILGSNDYELEFENSMNYSKNINKYFFLEGTISNENAKIENGIIEIKLSHKVNGTWKYTFGDYKKYYINISEEDEYILDSESNISWEIPPNAELGEYKFLVRTSFNAIEKGQIRGISTPSFYLN